MLGRVTFKEPLSASGLNCTRDHAFSGKLGRHLRRIYGNVSDYDIKSARRRKLVGLGAGPPGNPHL